MRTSLKSWPKLASMPLRIPFSNGWPLPDSTTSSTGERSPSSARRPATLALPAVRCKWRMLEGCSDSCRPDASAHPTAAERPPGEGAQPPRGRSRRSAWLPPHELGSRTSSLSPAVRESKGQRCGCPGSRSCPKGQSPCSSDQRVVAAELGGHAEPAELAVFAFRGPDEVGHLDRAV